MTEQKTLTGTLALNISDHNRSWKNIKNKLY